VVTDGATGRDVASGDRGVVDVSKTVARGRSREVSDRV